MKKISMCLFGLIGLTLGGCSSSSPYNDIWENSDPVKTCGGTVVYRLKKDVENEFVRGTYWVYSGNNHRSYIMALPTDLSVSKFCGDKE